MYYYVNILLTKNALNTFISNENNFVQNQLLRSADSISFSFIPVAYSALLCWSPASIDFNGAALNSFFQCLEKQHGSGREWESFFREWNGIFLQFFRGIGREEIKVCDAFWKQEMSPWSNAPPGLRNPFSKTYF